MDKRYFPQGLLGWDQIRIYASVEAVDPGIVSRSSFEGSASLSELQLGQQLEPLIKSEDCHSGVSGHFATLCITGIDAEALTRLAYIRHSA